MLNIVANRFRASESSCGCWVIRGGWFESWSWHLCPWTRNFTIIPSLHPGVNGYLWWQILFLWLMSLVRYIFGSTGCGCIRLASLGRPQYVPIALTSFQGLTRVGPQCPACGVGHLGVTRGACRHHERVSDRSSSSCQGLTRVSTAW